MKDRRAIVFPFGQTLKRKKKKMPANIFNRDVQVGLEMAWHGGTKVVDIVKREDAFPYEIERLPLFVQDGEPLEGWSYFRCSDDQQPAGVPVPESYTAINNERFWEISNNAIGGSGAVIESAGTLFNRCRRFITVKLGTDMDEFKVGERTFKNRFSLLDSIDQSTNLYGVNSSTCVVCSNTFAIAMADRSGEFRFKLRHSKNLVPKIENMEKAIDNFVGVSAQFKKALEIANSVPVKADEARSLFAGWAVADTGGISSRTYNTVGRLTDLFNGGKGNRGETLLDAFSAVTDYYSHESSGGEDQPGFRMKQALSSEFGAGNRKKQEFFGALFVSKKNEDPVFNRSSFQNLVDNGRTILKAADLTMVAN